MEAWTKWLTFCRQYFNRLDLVQERHNSIANALEICLSCTNPSICKCTSLNKNIFFFQFYCCFVIRVQLTIHESALVPEMAWRQTCNKPLPEPIMTKFCEAIWIIPGYIPSKNSAEISENAQFSGYLSANLRLKNFSPPSNFLLPEVTEPMGWDKCLCPTYYCEMSHISCMP